MPLHDARALDGRRLSADLCIIGAGAAGISIAAELADTGLRVALIESGDLRHRHRTQSLYVGRNTGRRSFSTVFSRFRRLGGSTTRWGGQCRPLDPVDFLERDAIAHSGWPFGFETLEPYYRRASIACRAGDFEAFLEDDAATAQERETLRNFPHDVFDAPRYRFAYPRDFSKTRSRVLNDAPGVHVYLNANLVEIEQDRGGERVRGLTLATLDRRRLRVEAGIYVLACGGIENARVLLANDRVAPGGIGNDHDLVGRYFMDHPYLFPGRFEPEPDRLDPDPFTIHDYSQVGSEQSGHRGISLRESIREREGLNGAAMYLVRREDYKTEREYSAPGGRALNQLIDVLRHREAPLPEVLRDMTDLGPGRRDAALSLRRRLSSIGRGRRVYGVRIALEQTPHPDSRVTLGGGRDRLGMRRVDVHWRVSGDDLRGFHRLLEEVGETFAERRLGRLVTHENQSDEQWLGAMTGGKHHIGTTRMHEDAREGVVNADCRIHGMTNLFVAGSSVFPTQGYANPTLTIVALAIRLADHLREQFDGGGTSG